MYDVRAEAAAYNVGSGARCRSTRRDGRARVHVSVDNVVDRRDVKVRGVSDGVPRYGIYPYMTGQEDSEDDGQLPRTPCQ